METIKIEPTGTKEVQIILGKFRLTNGLRLSGHSLECEVIPTKEKLALETRNKSGNYYVIAFIEYDEDEEICDMRTVGPRFHEAVETYEDWKIVQTLIKTAYNLIVVANCNEEDE